MSGNKYHHTIYNSKSWLRQSENPFREMWHDLLASRELAWRLMVRDIKAQYRQSFLGIFWAFVPAIAAAAGFTLASNAKIINLGTTDIPYPVYVLFSMTLWQTFVAALNAPVQAVAGGKSILSRIKFPREALILSKLGTVLFDFGIKLILVVGAFLWFRISVTGSVLLAPVALVHLIMLGLAIGLFLAPLNGLYQDIGRGLSLLTGIWLFLTPVIFATPRTGWFGLVVGLNPVTPLLVTTRELATTGVISNPVGFWITSAIAFIGLLLAWVFYRVAMPYVIERASS
jgi:lipopolysaccharide transport system permease protein